MLTIYNSVAVDTNSVISLDRPVLPRSGKPMRSLSLMNIFNKAEAAIFAMQALLPGNILFFSDC